MTKLLRPLSSSLTAKSIAAREEAQAASTVKFDPPKSKRLATRPAITLEIKPGNVSCVHSGKRSQTLSDGASTIRGISERVAYFPPSSAIPPAAPRMTEVFSRSKSPDS